MALSSNAEIIEQEGKLLSVPVVASDIIYKGALVMINAAGFLAPAAPAAGSQLLGIAYEQVDNSAGAAGAVSCRVITEGCFVLKGTGFAQTNVGDQVFVTDDEIVTVTEGTGSKPRVGKIVKFLSSTQVLVKLESCSGVGAA